MFEYLIFINVILVFNDGTSKDLVTLQGTIPVSYKGNTYHIPVSLWIVDTHPNNAPMCFVKPTADMHIKVSRFCDHNGKVYLPYLHDWQPSQSDLLGLIQVMIITFGDYMPVYSKPKGATSTPYPPQPFMPQPYMPPTGAGYNPGGGPTGAYPPYPTGSAFGGGYPPYPNAASGAANPPYPSFPAMSGYPPTPASGGGYNPGYVSNFSRAKND